MGMMMMMMNMKMKKMMMSTYPSVVQKMWAPALGMLKASAVAQQWLALVGSQSTPLK
jgi:hypothetical protein